MHTCDMCTYIHMYARMQMFIYIYMLTPRYHIYIYKYTYKCAHTSIWLHFTAYVARLEIVALISVPRSASMRMALAEEEMLRMTSWAAVAMAMTQYLGMFSYQHPNYPSRHLKYYPIETIMSSIEVHFGL